jgi:ABC-2 type transport system permease protein
VSVHAVLGREWGALVRTPVALVVLPAFTLAAMALTFYGAGWLARGQADLQPFFALHPWLHLLFAPALTMRLWADERRLGTAELLLTLPIRPAAAVLGKWLAAWLFGGVALLLTMPLWITVNLLGAPDNGVILASYIGSWALLGAMLALGCAVSAATRLQVLAFLGSVALCFLLLAAGTPLVQDSLKGWAPLLLVELVSALSLLTHYEAITRGVLEARDLVYFILITTAGLIACVWLVERLREQP